MFKFLKKIASKLFKKKKSEPEGPEIQTILQSLFSSLLSPEKEEPAKVEAVECPFERFQLLLDPVKEGWIHDVFSHNEKPEGLLFLPSSTMNHLMPITKDSPKDPAEFLHVFQNPVLNLFDSRRKENSLYTLSREYTSPRKAALLWNVSDYSCYEIIHGGNSFFFFILDEPALQESIENDPRFQASPEEPESSGVLPKENQTSAPLTKMRLNSPEQFFISRLFFPEEIAINNTPVKTSLTEVIFSPEKTDLADGGWYRIILEKGNKQYNHFFFFNYSRGEEKYKKLFFTIVKFFMAKTLKFLKNYFTPDKVDGKYYPAMPNLNTSRFILFKGELNVFGTTFPFSFYGDFMFLHLFTGKLFSTRELKLYRSCPLNRQTLLLALNNALLGDRIFTIYDDFYSGGIMTVPDFLNLLAENDYKRLVSNFFLSGKWPPDRLKKLFFYEETRTPGKTDTVSVTSFNEKRFTVHLPQLYKEEWSYCVNGRALSRKELLSLNLEAMKEIAYNYMDRKLLFSYKGGFILETQFYETFKKKILGEVHKLLEDRRPTKMLDALPGGTAQNLLAAFPSKKLAMALMFSPKVFEMIKKMISRNYASEIEELIQIRKTQFDRNRLKPDELQEALWDFRKNIALEYSKFIKKKEHSTN